MLKIYTDGACFGNPGKMGIGVVIYKNGNKIKEIKKYIGMGTNNIAEYSAVIKALEEGKKLGETKIKILCDSQLVVKQIKGEYKVKNKKLKELLKKTKRLMKDFESVDIEHVPRERNKRADYLSKKAIIDENKKKA